MDDLQQSTTLLNTQQKQASAAALSSADGQSSLPFSDNSLLPPEGSLLDIRPPLRKRAADAVKDFSAYLRMVGRAQKLRKEDQHELDKFAKLSVVKKQIWMGSIMLKICERQDAMVAPDVVFMLPLLLKSRIRKLCAAVVIDPVTTSYIEAETSSFTTAGPTALIYDKVVQNVAWGFTKVMAEDCTKTDILMLVIRKVLTKKRSILKEIVDSSMGKPGAGNKPRKPIRDIVQLADEVVCLQKRAQVAVHLCIRLAIIRSVAAIVPALPPKAFWPRIDNELRANRAMPLEEQSIFLKSVLDLNIQMYGNSEDSSAAIENIRLATADNTLLDNRDNDIFDDTDKEFDELDGDEPEPQVAGVA